ncbi:IS110 family transposase [Edaphobacter aggregans]|uniref:IS110 family transposase n=1 Tax=Edaphobacter aggregans TaxID=570835 RepID=UPI0009FD5993|nr:IS110 family transposase [Edaphobacter aggregans]
MAKVKLSVFDRLRLGARLNRKERRDVEQRLSAADPGLEIVNRDAAGIDVGNESHFVAVPRGRDAQPVREFGSWTAALVEIAQWLTRCGIRTVVMQSTGVYWIAVRDVLQKHGLEVNLVDARGTKNVPGRKSDVQECQWLMRLHTYGLLRACFLPAPEIHGIRTVWRLRDQHIKDAGRCIQHMQKSLIAMNVQLHNALSDIGGTSGQAIIRALLAGQRDPKTLAALRDRRCMASEEEIVHSLQGVWKPDVLFELQQAVDAYDFYRQQMAKCDEQLKQHMALLPARRVETLVSSAEPSPTDMSKKSRSRKPQGNEPAFDLGAELERILSVNATTIDGINVMTVQTVLAEVGPDLSAWKTEAHWSSWLNLAPKRDVSGGRVIRHVREHRTNRVGNAFRMAAQALLRSHSYLGARCRYLRAKLGGQKAVKAMARVLACLYYRLVTKGQRWVDQGIEEFNRRSEQRELVLLQRKAHKHGMQLVPTA